MKIGELACIADVSRDTIRYYEKSGLLGKVSRPFQYNNYKDYDEENVEIISTIKELKNFGLTLNECKKVLKALKTDNLTEEFQHNFINKKLHEIDKQINKLMGIKKILEGFKKNKCTRKI